MSALKPCPFCGGEGRIGFIRDGAQVSCRRCHASVIAFSPDAQNSAIAAWNRRAVDDEVEELRAERNQYAEQHRSAIAELTMLASQLAAAREAWARRNTIGPDVRMVEFPLDTYAALNAALGDTT